MIKNSLLLMLILFSTSVSALYLEQIDSYSAMATHEGVDENLTLHYAINYKRNFTTPMVYEEGVHTAHLIFNSSEKGIMFDIKKGDIVNYWIHEDHVGKHEWKIILQYGEHSKIQDSDIISIILVIALIIGLSLVFFRNI